MGIVISEWITWVNGAEMGLGKVGGRAEKVRSRGGRILGYCWISLRKIIEQERTRRVWSSKSPRLLWIRRRLWLLRFGARFRPSAIAINEGCAIPVETDLWIV